MDLLSLTEVRVIGALIEKAVTTPDNYPLTLNALTHACNQASNRDPVTDFDEGIVTDTIETLRLKMLVHIVKRGDSRVIRYRHVVNETLELKPNQVAVMAVLMLRGPQTVGEVRTRSSRLHQFVNLLAVEETLNGLMSREPEAFVIRLSRQPGQKEVRYVHTLAGDVGSGESETGEQQSPAHTGHPGHPDDAVAPDGDRRLSQLEDLTQDLQAQVEDLRQQFDQFRKEFQ